MKIYYIGTGADDWTDAAVSRDGEYRRCSAACLDGRLMIDMAPSTPIDIFQYGGLANNVNAILYTHAHRDHYDPNLLLNLCDAGKPIIVGAEEKHAERIPRHPLLRIHPLRVGIEAEISGYRVLPLRANHQISAYPEDQPIGYVIDDGKRKLFWGGDGAWFCCDTWQALLREGPFDRMILDGTLGEGAGDTRIFEHNNLRMLHEIATTVRMNEMLTRDGQIWITHISYGAHADTQTLVKQAAADGIRVAEDEMEDTF